MKKILYVILHCENNKDRYINVSETWGKQVDYLFYGDYDDLDRNIISVSNNKEYWSNEEKHVNIFKYLKNNNINYEWYFFCDDDTFVNVNLLESKLQEFDTQFVHGSVINCYPQLKDLYYCSGGAGYLIHNSIFNKISEKITIRNTGYSDVTLGIFLKEMNIGVKNHTEFNSQPPVFFNENFTNIINKITYHYIKTKNDMENFLIHL